MLAVLLESRSARPRRIGSTLLSACAHGALIAAIVALTLPDRGSARSAPDVPPPTVTYVSPTWPAERPPAHPSAPTRDAPSGPTLPVIEPPVITPTEIPPVDLTISAAAVSTDVHIGRGGDAISSAFGSPGIPLGGTGDVNDVSSVDRAPALVGRALEPLYPPALRAAGVQGRVLAEFVVDTLGRAEMATLRFPELPDPRFGDAVREALARYRFSAGEVAGRKVRTRVVVPFEFRLIGR